MIKQKLQLFRGLPIGGGIAATALALTAIMAPAWGAERIQILQENTGQNAQYSFRSIGSVAGARNLALPETGGHILVRTVEGAVWSWGNNSQGQLGTGDIQARAGWAHVQGLGAVTAIAAGAQHSLALQADGTVWAWGANSEGQLGSGTLASRALPGVVPGLRDVTMIAAGQLFSVALRADGTVWAFGSNWNGLIPGESRKLIAAPMQVRGLSGIEAVAVYGNLGYARDAQGQIWVWGNDGRSESAAARLLTGDQLTQKAADLKRRFQEQEPGPLVDAKWLGNSLTARSVTAVDSTLTLVQDGDRSEYQFDGVVLDAQAGWAVAVISAEPATIAAQNATAASLKAARAQGANSLFSAGLSASSGLLKAAGSAAGTLDAYLNHSISLKADGTVSAWGENQYGQGGNGSVVDSNNPVCVQITGVVAVSTGGNHSMAVRNDLTVWTWGDDSFGQLGNGVQVNSNRTIPIMVPGLTGIVAVSGGKFHSLALKNDGTVWAWGDNAAGQLGDGTTTTRQSPVQVPGLTGITAISAGDNHSVARKSDGTVYSWGLNSSGQLGDGTTTSRLSPVVVTGLVADFVAAGTNHTLAIKSDGSVWTFGLNSLGQLGDGTKVNRTVPVRAGTLTGIVEVAGGGFHSVAVKSDGTVWTWGYNIFGALGTGNQTESLVPVAISGINTAVAAGAGVFHTLVRLSDGTVLSTGDNERGELGRGNATANFVTFGATAAETPCTYPAPTPSTLGQRLTAGQDHTLVLFNNGTVWGSGGNANGELGDGSTTDRTGPVQVSGLTNVLGVSTGGSHTLAVLNDGTVRSWGLNSSGQLGDGTTTMRLIPVVVPTLANITRISAGKAHSLARKSDGTVWSWGINTDGGLGDGTIVSKSSPLQVPNLTNVVSVSAGDGFSLALKADGTVWAWGLNASGQLGNGSFTRSLTPVQVAGLTGIIAISAGGSHSLALRSDGTVWAWGLNSVGQVGDGTGTNRPTISRSGTLTGVVAISAGTTHSLALTTTGTVWAWGGNASGQLGDSTLTTRFSPTPTIGMYGGLAIAAGGAHSVGLKTDGFVRAWGSNQFGQFGIAAPTSSSTGVVGQLQPGILQPVTTMSVTPETGTGGLQTFNGVYRTVNGYSTLQWVQMLFAVATDGGGQSFCFLHYDVQGNGLWLYGDGGFFVGPIAPGVSSQVLQNTLCAVNTQSSTVSGNGTTLTVSPNVIFKAAGARNIYLRTQDLNFYDTGWVQQGIFNTSATPPATPTVNPNAGSGASQTFVLTYPDPPGFFGSPYGWVQFLVANASDGGGQPFCFVHYDRAGNGLWMYSSDVGFFLGPITPGVASTALDSTACSVNPAGTTIQNNSGNLIVTVPVTMKPPMSGAKKLFERTLDVLRRDTGWVQTGTWTIP
ncbi:RCC1 repeat-containing protein [Paludibaculum fermentans]|uniref:RCC1 domain-containing protein n=1 Tax=Paludibaculum fermentans TaxID=1473598 RepID=UPI003EB6DA22